MIKRILVPTDFSEVSRHALKFAREIANKCAAEIFTLKVIPWPDQAEFDNEGSVLSPLDDSAAILPSDIEASRNVMNEWLEKCNCNARKLIEIGGIMPCIESCIADHNIDLVIMGSHGARGFKELISGSIAARVVNNSSVPVLVLKESSSLFKLNKVVLISELSSDDQELRIPPLIIDLLNSIDAEKTLLRINTPGNFLTEKEAMKAMDLFLEESELNVNHRRLYAARSVESGILEFTESGDYGMIVIGTHKRKGIKHLFMGSLSEDLVNHVSRPVLTYSN